MRESCSRFYGVIYGASSLVEVAHVESSGAGSYTVKAAARPPHSKKNASSVRGARCCGRDRVVVVLQGWREFFRAGGAGQPHVVAGGAGQLDGTSIFCYTVPVEKCVQKVGDSSRFFYFRHLLIGFRGYVKARHRRARPATHIEPHNCHPGRGSCVSLKFSASS